MAALYMEGKEAALGGTLSSVSEEEALPPPPPGEGGW